MQPFAIVPKDMNIPAGTMALVAGAIQMQLMRDVSPAWQMQASCTAFPDLQSVPNGYAIVFLVDDAQGKAGFHCRPEQPGAPPFALVTATSSDANWSLAASHEIIEMLIDPTGSKLVDGRDPSDFSKQVTYLVEACDPCQDPSFAYQVDDHHPVLVSDFCLPSFYGFGNPTSVYTFRRSVLSPFSIAPGGYISWRDSEGQWFQLTAFSGPTQIVGPLKEEDVFGAEARLNLRGALDRHQEGYAGPVFSHKQQSAAGRRYKPIRSASAIQRSNRDKILNQFLESF